MSANSCDDDDDLYYDIDEDQILSGLSAQELEQLETEIDRDLFSAPSRQQPSKFHTLGYSIDEKEEDELIEPTKREEQQSYYRNEPEKEYKINQYALRPTNHNEKQDFNKKEPEQIMMEKPQLRRVEDRHSRREIVKDDEEARIKEEIARVANHKTKRRRNRMNSGGITRRYCSTGRRNSSLMMPGGRRRSIKIAKEDKGGDFNVNRNFVTDEVHNVMSGLKKVKTKEPTQVSDVLSGIDLKHVTSGAITREDEDPRWSRKPAQAGTDQQNDGYSEDSWSDDSDEYSDEEEMTRSRMIRRREEFTREKKSTAGKPQFNIRTGKYDVIEEMSVNATGVEETINRIWDNDPTLTEVNLNNIQNVPMDMYEELSAAMEANTHVTSLNLANTNLQDKAARCLAKMLAKNKHLQKLNVESNYITGNGALRIMANTKRCRTLQELKIDNQRHLFGARVEGEFVRMLKENKSIIRFGYQFTNPGFRMSAANCLTKNMDDVRKKRVMEQRMRAAANQNKMMMHHPGQHVVRRVQNYVPERARPKKVVEQKKPNLDVREVLGDIKPHEMELLQKWFAAKMAEEQAVKEQYPHLSPQQRQQILLDHQRQQHLMEQRRQQQMIEQQRQQEYCQKKMMEQQRQQIMDQQKAQNTNNQSMEQQRKLQMIEQQKQQQFHEQQRQKQLLEQQRQQQLIEQQRQQQLLEQHRQQQMMEQQRQQQLLEQQRQRQQQIMQKRKEEEQRSLEQEQRKQEIPAPPPVIPPPPPTLPEETTKHNKKQKNSKSNINPQQKENLRDQLMNSIKNPPKGRNYLNKVKRKSCLHWYNLPEKKDVGQDDRDHISKKQFIPAYKDVKEATKKFEHTPTKGSKAKPNPAKARESLLDSIRNVDSRPKLKQVQRKSFSKLHLPEPTIEEKSGESNHEDDDDERLVTNTPKAPSVTNTPKTPSVPSTPKTPSVPGTPKTSSVPSTPKTPSTLLNTHQSRFNKGALSAQQPRTPNKLVKTLSQESTPRTPNEEGHQQNKKKFSFNSPPVEEKKIPERRLSSSFYVKPNRVRELRGQSVDETTEDENKNQKPKETLKENSQTQQQLRKSPNLRLNIPTRKSETEKEEENKNSDRRGSNQETPTFRSSFALHPSTPSSSKVASNKAPSFLQTPKSSAAKQEPPVSPVSNSSSSYRSNSRSLSTPKTSSSVTPSPVSESKSSRTRSTTDDDVTTTDDPTEDESSEYIEYEEGQEYDSDEYEIIEVSVTDTSDDESAPSDDETDEAESTAEEESSSSSSSDENEPPPPPSRYARPYFRDRYRFGLDKK